MRKNMAILRFRLISEKLDIFKNASSAYSWTQGGKRQAVSLRTGYESEAVQKDQKDSGVRVDCSEGMGKNVLTGGPRCDRLNQLDWATRQGFIGLACATGQEPPECVPTGSGSVRLRIRSSKSPVFTALSTFAFLMALISEGHMATITANSPAFSDVQAAVNRANAGDTVVVPAGTATWTSTLT